MFVSSDSLQIFFTRVENDSRNKGTDLETIGRMRGVAIEASLSKTLQKSRNSVYGPPFVVHQLE